MAYYKRMLNISLLLFFVNAWMGIMNISFFWAKSKVFINPSIGFLNIAVAALIALPIIKIYKCKREFEKNHQLFE